MPIIHVRALPQKDPKLIQQALKSACVALANALDLKPDHVWATWDELASDHYVEGENSAPLLQPNDLFPPLVEILSFEGRDPEKIEAGLLACAKALGNSLGIADNIFMTYRELNSGRVFDGGQIVKFKDK